MGRSQKYVREIIFVFNARYVKNSFPFSDGDSGGGGGNQQQQVSLDEF